ncbi:thiopeptide-type bacteriocin biosynthesis protein [Chryseobacterium sp. Chry.R1]|uniref:thiopeptide-type bacteriocin biosynthesis protein n=1 Tax=Chryseobacterium sp. Chry.R1 TaxID=3139392 RepID=UPI0031F7D5A2
MRKIWNTYYLYYEGSADLVLKEIVYPSIQDIQDNLGNEVKFFFIRYFEDGYHIRLRLFLSAEESSVLLLLLKKNISVYEHSRQINIVVKEAEYIPETDRYGNTDTIEFAESQFCASSRFVLQNLMYNSNLTSSERYLLAIEAHLTFFKGIGIPRNHCQELCQKFVESWLPVPFSNDMIEEEQNRRGILSAFEQQFNAYRILLYERTEAFWNSLDQTDDPFVQQFLKITNEMWEGYFHSQLPPENIDEALLSFIHMTNNRLGITNSEESYLLFLIMKIIPLIKDYDNKQRT